MRALRLWRQLKRSHDDRLGTAEERRLAGRINGALWLSGGLTLLVMLPMPGERIERLGSSRRSRRWRSHGAPACCVAVRWEDAPHRLFHLSTAAVLGRRRDPAAPHAGARPRRPKSTSGSSSCTPRSSSPRGRPSPTRSRAASLPPPRCSTTAAPSRPTSRASCSSSSRCSSSSAAIIFGGRGLLGRLVRQATALEGEQRRMAEEQSSLRRVATAVAARRAARGHLRARLLGGRPAARRGCRGDRALHLRPPLARHGHLAGRDGRRHRRRGPPRRRARARPRRRAADPHRPLRRRHAEPRAPLRLPLVRRRAGARRRRDLGRARRRRAHGRRFPLGSEERLRDYAELIATAVSNAEDRTRLDRQAGEDPLTGLPNYRAFRDRLENEVSRARRHGRPLTVAVVDVDRFGDATTGSVTRRASRASPPSPPSCRSAVRDEDVVARLGADELGIAFVESDRATALLAAERARQLVAHTPLRHGMRLTVSVGLCDLEAAPSADELLRRADAALFWSKEHGRDRSWVYDPAVVRDLAGYARRRDLERDAGPRRAARARPRDRREGPRHAGALRARRVARRAAGGRARLAAGARRAPARGGAPARRRQDRRAGRGAAQARPARPGRDRAHARARGARRADRRRRARRDAGPLDRGPPRAPERRPATRAA